MRGLFFASPSQMGRGTRRSLVEGYMAQASASYPSTTLRVVPLPPLRAGRQ
jgi:hypothetical protein